MGKLPLTFAGKEAVPGVPMARNIGPKMNIHAQDAIYEAGIREAGDLGTLGDAVGDIMGKTGGIVREYVQNQKAKDDKAKYIEAMDLINQDYEENFQKDSLQKATDLDTGKVDWAKYGEFFEGDKTAYMQNAFARVQANDEVRGMVEKDVNGRWGSSRKLSHVKFRVEAQQEQTNEIYTAKVAQAIQAQDAPTAIAMIKLRAVGSPELQITMAQDIRNASAAVWNNEQKAAILNDPNNYKPSEMTDEEIPDYVIDKDKVRAGLVLHRKSVLRQMHIQDSVNTSDKVEEIGTAFMKGDYGYDRLTEDREIKDSQGKPMLSAAFEMSMRKNIKAAADGKTLAFEKAKFEALRLDVYKLNPMDPDYKIKKAQLDRAKMEFPVTQMRQIDSEYKKAKELQDQYKKLPGDIKDTFDALMDNMKADFNVADLYAEKATLAIHDFEEGTFWDSYPRNIQKSMQAYDQSRSQLMTWINAQKEPPNSAEVINKFDEIRMPYDVERKATELARPVNMGIQEGLIERNGKMYKKHPNGNYYLWSQ